MTEHMPHSVLNMWNLAHVVNLPPGHGCELAGESRYDDPAYLDNLRVDDVRRPVVGPLHLKPQFSHD